jgi:2-polyprenyl-6-methoxyphenol hydroxylase-like FAD-dependent oxidoreductase
MKRIDVLVVGGGPVGLFLSAQLLRLGHSCIVVERNANTSIHSKALAIMPRTLEMFDRVGLSQSFVSRVNRVRGVRFVTPRAASYVGFDDAATRYPFVSILPQWKTEALLLEQLWQAGGTVRYGHNFTRFSAERAGVRATIGSGQRSYEVDARYLIGCDGVGSAVRDQAAIPFPGTSYDTPAVLADVAVETAIPPDEARVHMCRGRVVTLFPMSATIRRIVVIAPREVLPPVASAGWLQSRVADADMPVAVTQEPLWCSLFRVQRRVVPRMRSGNILLAGDSAHAHSPVGGQGMNLGLEDAWALAQSLSSVLRGEADESAFDYYEARRLRVARAVVRRTDMLLRALAHPHPLLGVGRELIAPYVIGMPVVRNRVVRDLLTA